MYLLSINLHLCGSKSVYNFFFHLLILDSSCKSLRACVFLLKRGL